MPDIRQSPLGTAYNFADQEDTWAAVLAPTALSMETRAYERFPTFLDRLQRVLQALCDYIQPSVLTRVGLRYINEIRSSELEWVDIIQPDLLALVAAPELAQSLVQTLQESHLRFPDGRGMGIRNGLFPEGTTVRPRSQAANLDKPFYLLDFDAFREIEAWAGEPVSVEAVCNQVQHFHDAIYRLFRWSVTDSYLDTLRSEGGNAD